MTASQSGAGVFCQQPATYSGMVEGAYGTTKLPPNAMLELSPSVIE